MQPGALVPGNIDLRQRPVVRNPDGSISTVRSMSFGTDQGEVLIPTVSDDGRILPDEEAVNVFRQTGRHLGIFGTPDEATAYARTLSGDQARQYAPQGESAMRPLGLALQNAINPRARWQDQEAPMSPPGAPPANPLGMMPPAASAQQQAPAEAIPNIPMPTDAPRQNNGLSRGQLIMGIIADAIAGAQGRSGQFAQMMGQRRQQENEMAQWQLQRRAGLEDYEARQQIEQRYARPPAPSEFDRMLDAAGITDPAERRRLAGQRLTNTVDPIIQVDMNGDGVPDWTPRSAYNARVGASTPAPVMPTLTTEDLDRMEREGGPGPAGPATFQSGFIDPNLRGRW